MSYHGTHLVDKLEEMANGALRIVSHGLDHHRLGRNLKGNVGDALKVAQNFDEYTRDEAYRTPTNTAEATAWLIGNYSEGRDGWTKGIGNALSSIKIGDKGIDPRITNFVTGEVLDGIATAGIGNSLRLAKRVTDIPTPPKKALALANSAQNTISSGPNNQLLSPTVMKAVTATDPESLRLGGAGGTAVKTGDDIVSGPEAKHYLRRNQQIQQYVESLPKLRSALDDAVMRGDAAAAKSLRRQIEEQSVMLSRKRSNVSVPTKDDPLWYKTTAGKREKVAQQKELGLQTGEYLEQHHLFPKIVSATFFAKMDEFISKGTAEFDDLVLMNNIAVNKGRKPGDYRSGMLNMQTQPHNELHTALKLQGDEFKAEQWEKIVNQAKDVDELLVLWRDTIDNNVIPTAKDAESINKLDPLLQSLKLN